MGETRRRAARTEFALPHLQRKHLRPLCHWMYYVAQVEEHVRHLHS